LGESSPRWTRSRITKNLYGWAGQNFHWPLLSVAVGIVAGLGAILFEELLRLAVYYFLHLPAGFLEPSRTTEAAMVATLAVHRHWLYLIIPALGGLTVGLIVMLLAPEAGGEGADAMIESFHHREGYIRRRVPLIKIVVSAITIGSGGSAGKEGPIAQIGAGFGSILASLLNLKPKVRRILVLAGAAGGIGAIFHAPLGAALFAPEVLYREAEFETAAIMPCIVSSIVASSVFDQYYGRTALFFPGHVDFTPKELLPYFIFGCFIALAGYAFIKVFISAHKNIFGPLNIPRFLKPALGGLILGAIAYLAPPVLDGGYGWIQTAMQGELFWATMLALAFLKIVATSTTVGSGGSGGILGPSVFIGSMLGGAFGFLGHKIAPGWIIHPNSFVLVGIGGFFGGVAKVPVSAIIMASEMCGSYTLLVPLMLVAAVAYILLGSHSIYEKQLVDRLASPAHLREFARGVLENMVVHESMDEHPVTLIPENMPFDMLVKLVTGSQETHFPVIDSQGKLIGILSINDVREFIFEESLAKVVVARDIANPNVVTVSWDESLQSALDKMARLNVDELPVTQADDPDKIAGIISKRDIISHYHQRMSP
jgi:CIC family chloride channel protein